MENEEKELIGDAYNNYCKHFAGYDDIPKIDWFIQEIKTDSKFSEKWGLKIEERELDMLERWKIADLTPNMSEFDYCNKLCDEHNVPTKLITITYNKETIGIYE